MYVCGITALEGGAVNDEQMNNMNLKQQKPKTEYRSAIRLSFIIHYKRRKNHRYTRLRSSTEQGWPGLSVYSVS